MGDCTTPAGPGAAFIYFFCSHQDNAILLNRNAGETRHFVNYVLDTELKLTPNLSEYRTKLSQWANPSHWESDDPGSIRLAQFAAPDDDLRCGTPAV